MFGFVKQIFVSAMMFFGFNLLHSPYRGIKPPLLGSVFPHFLKCLIPPPYQQIGLPKFSLLTKIQL